MLTNAIIMSVIRYTACIPISMLLSALGEIMSKKKQGENSSENDHGKQSIKYDLFQMLQFAFISL